MKPASLAVALVAGLAAASAGYFALLASRPASKAAGDHIYRASGLDGGELAVSD